MKRAIAGLLLCSMLATRLVAQAGGDAVAIAAQREAEENYKRLSATLEDLQTTQANQQKRIAELAGEVSKLREELSKANSNAAMEESVRRLNEQIRKVDESRVADNKKLYEAMEKLGKLIAERPALPPPPRDTAAPRTGSGNGTSVPPPRGSGAGATEEGYDYIIQPGDRLDLIVKEYRKNNIPVTMKMIMDANPSVKWEKLHVGQKIFIPKPK